LAFGILSKLIKRRPIKSEVTYRVRKNMTYGNQIKC